VPPLERQATLARLDQRKVSNDGVIRGDQLIALAKLREKGVQAWAIPLAAALVAATLCLLSVAEWMQEERTPPEQPGGIQTATLAEGPEDVGSPSGMIVRYSEGANRDEVKADLTKKVKGVKPGELLKTANAQVFAVEGTVDDAVRIAQGVPGVEYVERNQEGVTLFSPDDRIYKRGKQWGPDKINARKAWEISSGDIGPGPDIGILGTGYFPHPDLKDKVVSEYDCGNDDGRADPWGVHGTHVAGIAGALADNGRGIAGITPEADLFFGRVFTKDDDLLVENVVQCGDVAMRRGVKVISISLSFEEKSRLLQEAAGSRRPLEQPRHQRRGRRRQLRLTLRV